MGGELAGILKVPCDIKLIRSTHTVHTRLKGCEKWADTKDYIHFSGRDPELLGDSDPSQNVCGTDFNTFILGERGIRLCQDCRVKIGLIW
jgi:hypothetical protein